VKISIKRTESKNMNECIARKFGLSAFTLKIIAIIAMTCCHVAIVFESYLPLYLMFLLNTVGGLTFPIMAYLIVEGYNKTSNIKKYLLRLFFFGLASAVPAFWILGRLSVLFTLLLGLCSLLLRDRVKKKYLFWLCFIGMVLATVFFAWSLIGVPLIFAYGTIKGEKRKVIISTTAVLSVGLALTGILDVLRDGLSVQLALDTCFMFAGICTIPLLLSYNGKRGYSPSSLRYLFYIYYPVHLLVLSGLKWLI
jgi:hypothetical protein